MICGWEPTTPKRGARLRSSMRDMHSIMLTRDHFLMPCKIIVLCIVNLWPKRGLEALCMEFIELKDPEAELMQVMRFAMLPGLILVVLMSMTAWPLRKNK